MRNYYASDKKKREDAKRKRKEEKRLRRLNKNDPAKDSTQSDAGQALNVQEGASSEAPQAKNTEQ